MATNEDQKQTEAGRHQEVGHKSLLQSDALYQVHIHPFTCLCLMFLDLFSTKRDNIISTWSLVPSILLEKNWVLDKIVNWVFCTVYSGDQCIPKRKWSHERVERVDSKAPMVYIIKLIVPSYASVSFICLILHMGMINWLIWLNKTTGT